jgi:hypothetical protein
MRLEIAVALIPVLGGLSENNRKLLKQTLTISPLPEPVAKFGDRLPEANAVIDFLDVIATVNLPALPESQA